MQINLVNQRLALFCFLFLMPGSNYFKVWVLMLGAGGSVEGRLSPPTPVYRVLGTTITVCCSL